MEKRWSERKTLRTGVDICQQGSLLDSCFSRDIGLGGAFLCLQEEPSGLSRELHEGVDVELVFSSVGEGQPRPYKINARVTRHSDEGIGLKFCDFDTGVFRSLRELMA